MRYKAVKNYLENSFKYFKNAITLNPKEELLHYYYGIALLQAGLRDEAIIELTQSKFLGEKQAIDKLKALS